MKHLNHITLSCVFTLALAGLLATAAQGASPFTYTGSLGTPRFGHTASLLPNGKVLVAGGLYVHSDEGGTVTDTVYSAELYDPATGTWSFTGGGPAGSGWTATLLSNGNVLVTAGTTAELYNLATGWSSTGSLGAGHFGHTATLLANGKVLVAGGGTNSAELYDPATGYWSFTGSLGTARFGHIATLLSNGKVLVAGGYYWDNNSYRPLASAELYDPATGTWSSTGSLGTARNNHTATLLPNGKVLVAGGSDTNGVALGTAELYDPVAGAWSPAASLLFKRAGHSATLLTNGIVLVTGGGGMGAELYDPAAGAWSYTGNGPGLPGQSATLLNNGKVLFAGGNSGISFDSAELYDPAVPNLNTRSGQSATLLSSGKVLIVGGRDSNSGGTQPTAELVDPATGARSYTGSPTMAQANQTATLLASGRVLVVWGNGGYSTAELYDPATGTWTWSSAGSYALQRSAHTATLLTNGKVLVAGGAIYWDVSSKNAELYNPVTGTWSTTGSLRTERYAHTATLLPNGKVLVAGGSDHNGVILGRAELYNPATGKWSFTGSLGTARTNHTATLLPNGKVLVVGGVSTNVIGGLASAELYNPATGKWSFTGSLAAGRYNHTATLLPSGKVLVTGGYDSNNYPDSYGVVASVELYDPATGAWLPDANLVTPRTDHTATLRTNGMVFIAGGTQTGSFSELYDPTRSFINPIFNPARLGDGSFQFHFTGNPSGTNCRVLASTDLAAPLNTWSNLGPASETPPGSGQFQFTDHQAPNYPQRFYRVSSP